MGETYPAFCCSSDRAIVLDIFSHEMFETDTSIFGEEMILGVRYKRREERERMKRDCWKNTQQFRRSRYFLTRRALKLTAGVMQGGCWWGWLGFFHYVDAAARPRVHYGR
jgi:hypothetical protein